LRHPALPASSATSRLQPRAAIVLEEEKKESISKKMLI
jgi:hypothetical protein